MSSSLVVNYQAFVDPPKQFRSIPFWSLNDLLESGEIQRQLEEFKRGGFGGAYLHSRVGLLTEYLGEDWWKAMDAGVAAAERLELEAWFYDEDKWPSGFAGGKVPLMREDYRARCILRLEKHQPVPASCEVMAEDQNYHYVCHTNQMGDPWFNGTCWVDLMNPKMVEAFIDCSYKPYAERYAGKVGGTVQGIFTDEPQISPRVDVPNKGAISYSPIIREDFKAQHGYDFVDHMPSLFEDVGDFRKVRLHYYRTIAKRFEESFSKQIGEYCAKTGMTWTGHYNAEENLRTVTRNVGNMMVHYRHMQRPGIDHLGLHIDGGLHAARSLSSVANQYGLPRRLSEMFGISGQNMSFEDRKWIADWHAVLGINHVCPHLSLYSMKGCRKRDFPPTISPQQPYWHWNKMVEDHMARLSYATTVGQYAPEILVVHPLESGYMEYELTSPFTWDSPRGENHYAVLETIQQAHRDFDLGDEQIMADIATVEADAIRVGKMRYHAVVLPYMATIRRSTLELLEKFAMAGGPVLTVGGVPELVDAEVDEQALARLRKIVRGVTVEELPAVLASVLPPAVTVTGPGSQDVWIHRRTVGTGQLIVLTNTSRLAAGDCVVHLPQARNGVLWDPSTGRCFKLKARKSGGYVLHFDPATTVIITTGSASSTAKTEGTYMPATPAADVLTLSGSWSGRRQEPNAITLDFARYSVDGGKSFSQPEPVIGIHERFTRDQYKGPLTMAFDVQIDQAPAQCSLVLEQPEMYSQVQVNGQAVSFAGSDFYRDNTFRRTDVSKLLKAGVNTVTLSLNYVAPVPASLDARTRYGSEIESIYLVGEFGVKAEVSQNAPAPTQRDQRGFLAPLPVHRFSGFSLVGETNCFDGDLAMKGYPFFAGAFELTQSFDLASVEPGKRYFLSFPAVEAIVITGQLNGQALPPLAWSPKEVEITGALKAGRNELTLTLVNSMRNLLGPHHHHQGELISVGPESFTGRSTWTGGGPGEEEWYDLRARGLTKIWRDDYHHIPFGLLAAPKIVSRA